MNRSKSLIEFPLGVSLEVLQAYSRCERSGSQHDKIKTYLKRPWKERPIQKNQLSCFIHNISAVLKERDCTDCMSNERLLALINIISKICFTSRGLFLVITAWHLLHSVGISLQPTVNRGDEMRRRRISKWQSAVTLIGVQLRCWLGSMSLR